MAQVVPEARRSSLGVGRRAKYLVKRVAALNLGNLFRVAGKIARKSRRPRLFVVVDMLWCSVYYEAGFADYFDWDFHQLSRAERKTFMTHPKSNHLALKLNSREHRQTFIDKSQFNERFAPFVRRRWLDVRKSSTAELEEFVESHGRVMLKVTDSLSGLGIEKRNASDISDYESFRRELLEKRQFLVEEFISQHPAMESLCPTSVNTLRIITYFTGTDVVVLARVMKIGNGNDIDNFSNGGMYTMLDEAGVAHYAAFDGTGATYETHPLTGTSIVGFAVPLFDRVLSLVDEVARVVPEIPYVGWDIAITADGPLIIEGNYATGVYQTKPSVSGIKTGLLPHYRSVIGF